MTNFYTNKYYKSFILRYIKLHLIATSTIVPLNLLFLKLSENVVYVYHSIIKTSYLTIIFFDKIKLSR